MDTTTRSRDDGRTDLAAKSNPKNSGDEDVPEAPQPGRGETPRHSGGEGDTVLDDGKPHDNTEKVGCPYCDTWRGANNKLPFHLTRCPEVDG